MTCSDDLTWKNENNHENLEEQEDHPFDYLLQSTAWLLSYQKHLSYNTAGNTMSTCVWQRYDPQYCLQSKLGSNTKRKQDIINKSNQKENKNYNQIPYEYKVYVTIKRLWYLFKSWKCHNYIIVLFQNKVYMT
jgi:hypothetical protein